MHYLFVHFSPDVLGGIETLIGRLAGHLISRGDSVSVLTTTAVRWAHVVPQGVRLVQLGRRFRNLFYPFLVKRTWTRCKLPLPDIIKTFDLPTAWCGTLLARHFKTHTRIVAGIYNPYVFDLLKGGQVCMDGWSLYLRNYLSNIALDSRVVCDYDIALELSNIHGVNQTAHLWPLPIDDTRFRNIPLTPVRGQIVSVGRLARMKEYNFHMVDVIRKLRSRGHDVRWIVYGSGPYESELRDRIKRSGVQSFVELRGDISYDRLAEAFSSAYVFVGMGTSILEASFCRVPNVVAVPYDQSGQTYGPIYRLPIGMLGQSYSERASLDITNEIERILQLSECEYERERLKVYEYVQPYRIKASMGVFESIVANSKPPMRSVLLPYMNYVYAAARVFGIHLGHRRAAGNKRSLTQDGRP